MNIGLAYNIDMARFSNLTGSDSGSGGAGGGSWIGSLISTVGSWVNTGINLAGTKDTNKSITDQIRLASQASTLQAGYQALGNDTADEILAQALANRPPLTAPVTESAFSKNIVWIGLIAAVTLIVVVMVYKSDSK